jgi:hypothetical protein
MKVSLEPDAAFMADVGIHVPGKGTVEVTFTFKHRGKKELDAFLKESKGKDDAAYIMMIASGWELEEEFNKKNVETFITKRHGSALAITDTYFSELLGAKEKN